MCFTAKLALEWILSSCHVPVGICCSVATDIWLPPISPFALSPSGSSGCTCNCITKPDRGPDVILPKVLPMETRELNVISGPQALPTVDAEPCERADAARNRRRILAAAAQLIEERGIDHVSMEAIAVEAGVGKGTLFRRFGDRSGLVMALLDQRTREFQDALIRGEPPLGPGAPPVERVIAFGRGMVALLEASAEMMLAAEFGARWVRGETGVYALYRTHLAMLVREAAPELDDEYLAEALLTSLGPETFLYLRKGRELPLERIEAGYEQLVRRLLSA